MDNLSIFKYLEYKNWLSDWFKRQGHGSISRVAKYLNCQRSYISQVLNSHVHLTPDKCFRLGKIALSTDLERRYLAQLLELARAGNADYKAYIVEELKRLSTAAEKIENLVGRDKELLEDCAKFYYSAWYWQAIHIATSLAPLLSEKELSEKLNLDQTLVSDTLRELERYGLVEFSDGFYRYKSGGLHLKKDSPWLGQFHLMWRQKSNSNFIESKRETGVRFTVVQSISKKEYQHFQEELLELIRKFELMAGPSEAETLINFNLDFVQVFKDL